MKRVAILGLLSAIALLGATGCGGGGGSTTKTAQLRTVNAVADSAGYDVTLGGATFTTNLTFATASAYASVSSGSQTIEFLNTGTSTAVINQSVSLTGGSSYTFVALGLGTQISGVPFTDNSTKASSGNIQLRIINASSAQGAFDVYITPPGTNLFSVTADFSGLAFGSASAYKTFAAGDYEIRITAPNSGQKIAIFDSGTITYASGAVNTIILEDSSGGTLPMTMQQLTDAT
jgi:hypothetical protein